MVGMWSRRCTWSRPECNKRPCSARCRANLRNLASHGGGARKPVAAIARLFTWTGNADCYLQLLWRQLTCHSCRAGSAHSGLVTAECPHYRLPCQADWPGGRGSSLLPSTDNSTLFVRCLYEKNCFTWLCPLLRPGQKVRLDFE